MARRSFSLCILVLLLCLKGGAQSGPDYDQVDAYVAGLHRPVSSLRELDSIIARANKTFMIPEEKIRFAFRWVAENLEYDCREDNGTPGPASSLEDVLKTGKSTCSGYSGLLNYALKLMGFESVAIRGVAKTAKSDLFWEKLPRPNHSWNAVKVNNTWKLLDATWASGEASENCDTVIRSFSAFYFFPEPRLLALSHFPVDSGWQLTRDPVDSLRFLQWPVFHDPFYEKNVISFAPEAGIIRTKKNSEVKFRFQSASPLEKIAIWSDDRKSVGAEFGKFTRVDNGYEYRYRVKESGDYFLSVSLDGRRTALVYRVVSE
ncbi:MAG TPA: transglutaminase domain-containing protein [Chitinophagaceae bacterium]|nr:transglutaminase domain-containing protein [Chitinophagaceae bacterium]